MDPLLRTADSLLRGHELLGARGAFSPMFMFLGVVRTPN